MLIRFSAKGILTKTRMENEYHLKTNLEHLIKKIKTDRQTGWQGGPRVQRSGMLVLLSGASQTRVFGQNQAAMCT